MKYWISGELVSFRDASLLKPSSSYEVCRGRLIKLASRSSSSSEMKFVVHCNSVPVLFVTARDGHIVTERISGDLRTLKERDEDFRLAVRSRLKNQRVGFVSGDMSSWIRKPGSIVKEVR